MNLPNFIILGATKSGTTALWYNLDKHPDITMATKSKSSIEMNFWASGSNVWKKGLDWYTKRFPKTFCGEKSTMYYMKKQSIKQIKKHIPDAKLILCVRNPVDRAFSNYQMNIKAGKISEQLSLALLRKRYIKAGNYIRCLKDNVLPFFDKSQIYIVIMERMKSNPTVEMNKVFDFLGVLDLDYPKKVIGGQLLKHRSRQEDVKLNRKEKFYRVWSKHIDVMPQKIRKEALEYCRPMNKRLFKYLGYEIKEWSK